MDRSVISRVLLALLKNWDKAINPLREIRLLLILSRNYKYSGDAEDEIGEEIRKEMTSEIFW